MLLGMETNQTSPTKLAGLPQAPVFPQSLHRLRPDPTPVSPVAKPAKRDKPFSESRDTREDRGEHQMKTTHNSQTIPHAH